MAGTERTRRYASPWSATGEGEYLPAVILEAGTPKFNYRRIEDWGDPATNPRAYVIVELDNVSDAADAALLTIPGVTPKDMP